MNVILRRIWIVKVDDILYIINICSKQPHISVMSLELEICAVLGKNEGNRLADYTTVHIK